MQASLNMILRFFVILVLMASWASSALAGPPLPQMVITVDDLPVAPPSRHSLSEQQEITQRLIETLSQHRVPAIGFVNESKLEVQGEVDPDRVQLLEGWLRAGFELGNHGHSHLDLHRVTTQDWLADIKQGERALRPLTQRYSSPLRFFRYPFLHTGRTLKIKNETERFLTEHGYRVAPVTVDNSEWVFGRAYAVAHARGDEELKQRLGLAYLDYMEKMVSFYEDQAIATLGGPFPQVLLIHAYALNADWLGPLLTRLEKRGYQFIPLEEALKHPAYDRLDHYTGSGGITWLHRWALTAKMNPALFRGEPLCPTWVEDIR